MLRITLPVLAAIATSALVGGALAEHAVSAQTTSAPHGDPVRGKAAFVMKGCTECHGSVGQGNRSAGPKLAPHPIPYSKFVTQLRTPRFGMPSHSTKIVSDADAANIYAYLESIASGKAPVKASVIDHGRQIFEQNCAVCHRTSGTEGGIGPSLKDEKSHKNLQETVAFIKTPAPPMPKLYPSPLNDRDVEDVAAYVQSL